VFPYHTEAAAHRKEIDHPTDPSRNHPIHDAVIWLEYGGGRYICALALDGVSETKSRTRHVPIGDELCEAFAHYCHEQRPPDMQAFVDWFRKTTRDERFRDKGATTVCLIRFDREAGVVDGINLGDSVPLMVVERPRPGGSGPDAMHRRGAVLAPLHSVANEPSTVYKCWRASHPFEPDGFRLALPRDFSAVWLVTMSDGYAKLSNEVARRLYDLRRVDRILAKRYPDFVRVYLPEELAPLAPDVKRPKRGRVRFSTIQDNAPLKAAFTEYYRTRAGETERHEMEVVDLDTIFLQTLIQARSDPERQILGRTVRDRLTHGHRTLRWLTQAPYNHQEDDSGVEQYLRQYAVAELFGESMVAYLDRHLDPDGRDPARSLPALLGGFLEKLGQIGDDLCVGLIRITRAG